MIPDEFDYGNVDPETLKRWKTEYRNRCLREMTQYLKKFPDATPEEKRALKNWVRSGHSPYENGDYIATEFGVPMDFISACRLQEELYQDYLKNPEKFCNDPEIGINVNPESDLPF